MKKLLMSIGILLCCAQIFAQTAPTFSPTGGTYSSAQTVSISGCDSGSTATYTLDGTLPTIASTPYTGPFSVATTQTVKAMCAAQTSTSRNINTSSTGWKCVTLNGGTSGGLTCQSGGGIGTIQPSAWAWSFGTTMTESISTTASTSETQMLYVYAKTDTSSSTTIAEDKWVKPSQGSTYLANNELDMLQVDHSRGIEHMFGLQCNQQAAYLQWQYDNVGGSGWQNFSPPIKDSCPLPTGVYTRIAYEGHWINGDTGCGGKGCLYFDALTINGVRHVIGKTLEAATTTWSAGCELQDQPDLTNTTKSGANPTTAVRDIQNENLSCGYAPSAVTSATYTISGATVVATPTISPAAGTYATAQTVTLSDSTSGAGICYTTNGVAAQATGAGCTTGTLYTGSFSVASSQTVNAVAFLSGDTTSNPLSATYTIGTPTLTTPTATPAPGTYATTQSVVLTLPAGSAGCYRTDGVAPTAPTGGTCGSGSTTYSGAISVSSTETIIALATESGYTNSALFSGVYTIGTVGPYQGNIDYSQIKSTERLGNGEYFQMGANTSFTQGDAMVYDANGNAVDSGNLLTSFPHVYESGVLTQSARVYLGSVTLSGGSAAVTFGNSFAFTGPFFCFGDDTSATSPTAVSVKATGYSTIEVYGTGSDLIGFACFGT